MNNRNANRRLKRGIKNYSAQLRRERRLVGQRFGMLVVVSRYAGSSRLMGRNTLWKCICDCGEERYVFRNNLTSGNTKSCGKHSKKKS